MDSYAETESAADLAERLGLRFTNLHLLVRALTHRSYVNENSNAIEDNERLEFLGDAVLDFVVGAWVYNHFPEMQEGDLTRMRSALVRTDTLAEFARRLDLGPALRLGRGELASGGRLRDNLLCATFEAVIGAMYLDTGIPAVETFVEPLLADVSSKVISQEEIYDPKSTLQEWTQSNKLGTPRYVTVASSGPDHARIFVVEVQVNGKVYGRGEGTSKQAAAQMAAQTALESLDIA
ncbi:MAG: ribonuclease III [Anaerolineales bacterium]|nr:ribonuclease III [Anaerolineales bacterium]